MKFIRSRIELIRDRFVRDYKLRFENDKLLDHTGYAYYFTLTKNEAIKLRDGLTKLLEEDENA